MTVVVDASLALKWALSEDYTGEALKLWDRWQFASEHTISPPAFRSEITNALHQTVRRRAISPVDAAEMLDTLLNIVAIDEPSVLYDRALALAGSRRKTPSMDRFTWPLLSCGTANCGPQTAASPEHRDNAPPVSVGLESTRSALRESMCAA